MQEILELEKLRKNITRNARTFRTMALIVAFLVAVWSLMALFGDIAKAMMGSKFEYSNLIIYALCAIFVYFIYESTFSFLNHGVANKFVRRYKELYMKPYFDSLGLKYNRMGHVHALDLVKSALFIPFDKQSGNDQVSGDRDGVSFSFSDIVLENIHYPDEFWEDYRYKTCQVIFQGIFFVADFAKEINSQTIIMPKNSPSPKNLAPLLMDNLKFNQIFDTYTTNPQNAMYILTPSFMEKILNLQSAMRAPVSISFVQNRVFIAIRRSYDSFEPDINKSIVSKNLAIQIKQEIDAILEIIKILDLNSKIWLTSSKFKEKKSAEHGAIKFTF